MASPKPGSAGDMNVQVQPPSPTCDHPPAKSSVAFRMVAPEKDSSPNFVFSGALAYYTFTLGVGLLILGSILTFVLNDQSRHTYDPFSKNLTVTAILFLIIGAMLITSSIIKCLYPWCQGYGDGISETKIQQTSLTSENTIFYNPYYPPILVPYSVDNAPQPDQNDFSNENCKIAFPKGNVNLLPGSLIEETKDAYNEKIQELENKISGAMAVSANTVPTDEMRNSGSAIRGRDQILQVEDLRFDQPPKF